MAGTWWYVWQKSHRQGRDYEKNGRGNLTIGILTEKPRTAKELSEELCLSMTYIEEELEIQSVLSAGICESTLTDWNRRWCDVIIARDDIKANGISENNFQ